MVTGVDSVMLLYTTSGNTVMYTGLFTQSQNYTAPAQRSLVRSIQLGEKTNYTQ